MMVRRNRGIDTAAEFTDHRDWTDRLVMRMLLVSNVGVLVFALLGTWLNRHSMNPDGISYLDLADDVGRKGISGALNAYWSPAYPWVLALARSIVRPSAYWEFALVQFVNFGLFLGALIAFLFFWRELAHHHATAINRSAHSIVGRHAGPVWWVFGMVLFCQATLEHIPMGSVTPDMMIAASVFCSAGILLRIIRGSRWTAYAAFGLTLGAGYLSKAAMLPLGIVFLVCAAFFGPRRRVHWLRMLIALGMFGATSLLYVGGLSLSKDRVTFGDTGKLAYVRWVNGAEATIPFCHGEQTAFGRIEHPPILLVNDPAVYAFYGPVFGSFPAWKDPAYWCEGIQPKFDLGAQILTVQHALRPFLNIVLRNSGYLVMVVILFFILWINSPTPRPPLVLQWPLLLVSAAAFVMYSLVLMGSRYIAPFWAIFLGACLSSTVFKDRVIGRRTLNMTACVVAALCLILTADAILPGRLRDVLEPSDGSAHPQWQIAKGISNLGLEEGDAVGFIGDPYGAYWVRLAKVQLRVSVPGDGAAVFWSRSENEQARILSAVAQAGVKAVVVKGVPKHKLDSNWHNLDAMDYYARLLKADF